MVTSYENDTESKAYSSASQMETRCVCYRCRAVPVICYLVQWTLALCMIRYLCGYCRCHRPLSVPGTNLNLHAHGMHGTSINNQQQRHSINQYHVSPETNDHGKCTQAYNAEKSLENTDLKSRQNTPPAQPPPHSSSSSSSSSSISRLLYLAQQHY